MFHIAVEGGERHRSAVGGEDAGHHAVYEVKGVSEVCRSLGFVFVIPEECFQFVAGGSAVQRDIVQKSLRLVEFECYLFSFVLYQAVPKQRYL
ncbi:hypothetical protein SDC9_99751 [bioreactor metagenome]|uniref:Uncharacterized protein n=1 Tax=bioreactor metagenome TaxID=1076179 RepID=A0A645AIY2_9ZZZZ